jgi:flavin reductase (DIM6/NTAB) family NADH-FMN oxidoreductase RutF
LVVATVGDGLRSTGGCLVGFFTQCSIDPPRFLVCLSVLNHTFQLAQQCDGVVVHLLGEDQQATARLFAEETGDDTDKLARCHWRAGITGAPILTSCAAWLEGTIIGRHDLGDHQGLVLAPVDGGAGDRSGLLTFRDIGDQLRPGHPAD